MERVHEGLEVILRSDPLLPIVLLLLVSLVIIITTTITIIIAMITIITTITIITITTIVIIIITTITTMTTREEELGSDPARRASVLFRLPRALKELVSKEKQQDQLVQQVRV